MLDGIRLNPKCQSNGQSAAKPQTEERSTTRERFSYLASFWQGKWVTA
jgi:hypothetical protein